MGGAGGWRFSGEEPVESSVSWFQYNEAVTRLKPVGWDKVALDRWPTMFRKSWSKMVGLRPKRLVPPYVFRVASDG